MIKLRTLNLEALNCKKETGHFRLKRRLSEDLEVNNYISKNFATWVKEPTDNKEYEDGKTYVVDDHGKKIGMVGSIDFDKNGIIELWYTIDKEYRQSGYGEKLLAQITSYLIENVPGLNDIKLVINQNNIGSNKVAKYNGYNLTDENKGKNIYNYFAK